MSKKKQEEEILEDEDEEEILDYDEEDQKIEDDNEIIDSSLEIGGQIHQQSETVKRFYQIPKDVKYSNFGRIEIANFVLKSSTYDLFQYVRKIQHMAKYEIELIKENKKDFFNIETLEEFREYLRENNKLYLWENLRQLDPKALNQIWEEMKKQIIYTRESGFVDLLYGDRENFYNSLDLHQSNYNKDLNLVDDFGLLSSMMTSTEVNKAQKGWATKMMNTTISETRNEDLQKDIEEEPEQGESKGFGKFFKK